MPKNKNNNNNDDKENNDIPDFFEIKDVEDQRKVAKFIDDIIKHNIQKEEDLHKKRMSDYNNLLSINSEWLDSFLIIGFDMKGEEIILSNTRTAKDYNSVLNLLKKAFINLVVKHENE